MEWKLISSGEWVPCMTTSADVHRPLDPRPHLPRESVCHGLAASDGEIKTAVGFVPFCNQEIYRARLT